MFPRAGASAGGDLWFGDQVRSRGLFFKEQFRARSSGLQHFLPDGRQSLHLAI
jgi:hypothetical protein